MRHKRRQWFWIIGVYLLTTSTLHAQPLRLLTSGLRAGHAFAWGDVPALLIGDSVTQGWMECGTDFDQATYVRALAQRGITCLMLWSFIGPAPGDTDKRIGYDAPDQAPWVKTSESPQRWDLQRWNDAYWTRLKRLVADCRAHDIAVVITVFDGWTKSRFADHPFNAANGGPLKAREDFVRLYDFDREVLADPYDNAWPEARKNQYDQERFADKLIREFRTYDNVVFELFNEGEWYDPALRRKHEQHFARFFKRRNATLVMSNADHIRTDFDSNKEPDIDAISFHKPKWDTTAAPTPFFNRFVDAYRNKPFKPLFFSEPVPSYEGGAAERRANMRLLWGSLLGGAAGAVVQNDLSFGFCPKSRLAAQANERDAMLDIEGHCARFFKDLSWGAMHPDSTCATGVALSDPGREYVVYAWDSPTFRIDLSAVTGAAFQVRCYNPATGREQPSFEITASDRPTTIPLPSSEDWVVHLKKMPESQTSPRDGTRD